MASFTPQEIEQFLQQFFDVVGTRQYIGARYVPVFGHGGNTPFEWDNSEAYEPLSIVYHIGTTYTSRQYVPAGIDISDTNYWVVTANYNAQVEQYRQEVLSFQGQIDTLRNDIETDYVPFPDSDHYPKYGTLAQVLTTLANGQTKWEDPVTVDAAVAEPLIEDWLDEHPEATTTVQDGSVTDAKLYPDGLIKTAVKTLGVYTGTSANGIVANSWYFCDGASVNDCPNDTQGFWIETIALSDATLAQYAYNWTDGSYSFRRKINGTWYDWESYSIDSIMSQLPASLVGVDGVYTGTSANDIVANSWYFCDGASVDDCPNDTQGFWIETIALSDATLAQYAYNWTDGSYSFRRKVNNTWGDWQNPNSAISERVGVLEASDALAMHVLYGLYSGSDINDVDDNGYVVADGATVANLPDSTHAFAVQTVFIGDTHANGYQLAYYYTNGKPFYRRKVSGTWQSWYDIMGADGILANGTDLDTVMDGKYLLVSDYAYPHSPSSIDGMLESYTLSTRISTQTITVLSTGERWYRFRSGATPTWKSWRKPDNPYEVSGGYVAFGDSVTWSAIWDLDQSTPLYQAATEYQIPTRIAVACGMQSSFDNQAVGGSGYYVAVDGQTIVDRVKAYDYTNVDLVTIMGGVNDKPDATHPLGTATNPATGTICAAIKEIIDWFSANYPGIELVIIQPSPSGHLADPWTGTLAGGWSLNDFDTQVSQLCAAEHVGYVNWNDCTLAKNWDEFSGGYNNGAGPNYSHMATEHDSARIGDYLGGKVSRFFHGSN